MRLVPFENVLIQTDLPPTKVLSRLAEVVEPTRFFRNPLSQAHRPYEGEVGDRSFRMSPIIHYRNSFLPVAIGVVEARGSGAVVKVALRPALPVLAFTTMWLSITGLSGLGLLGAGLFASLVGKGDFQAAMLIPLGMFVFGFLMCNIGFGLESEKVKSFLCEHLGGHFEQRLS